MDGAMRGVVWILAAVLGGGCYLSHEREDAGGGVDAGRRVDGGTMRLDAGRDAPMRLRDAGVDAPDAFRSCEGRVAIPVDLLLVVDASGSMREEQFHLAEQLPELVRSLVDPPDEDGDGMPDWSG